VALQERKRDLDQLANEGVGAGGSDHQLTGREQAGDGLGPILGDDGIVRATHDQGWGGHSGQLLLDPVAEGEPVGGQDPAEAGVAVVA
jgi:hypothetical protein